MARLSQVQLAALKTDITNAGGGAEFSAAIAAKNWSVILSAYNAPASGTWIIWRSDVARRDIIYAIVMSDFVVLTDIKQAGLRIYLDYLDVLDATQPNVQAAFSAIFSGATLTALSALSKRQATRCEKLFSTGVGSNASPATVAVEAYGTLLLDDLTYAFST